jgi:hypothetical protein
MVAALVVLVGCVAAGTASAAVTTTTTFSTPGDYSFTVPVGVSSVAVSAIGGGGGHCGSVLGGRGASLQATVIVSPGEQLFVGVGAPGGACNTKGGGGAAGGIAGAGGGGAGGVAGLGGSTPGGAGAGASLVGASPAPGFGSLLVVAAGGGGAGGFGNPSGPYPGPEGGGGGDAGSPGATGSGTGPGSGGGAGTPSAGGAGGEGFASGSFGQGGAGGAFSGGAGGGGGGGGYFGGGGAGPGSGGGAGGGGGGSSFVAPGATSVSGPAVTSAAPIVSITYAAPTADESAGAINFPGVQPLGVASAEQTLTLTNNGSAPLVLSGVLLGGSNPGDYLIDDRCQQPLQPSSNCQIGVRFAPQAQGASSASLSLLTNAPVASPTVALSGTGGSLPLGPPGQTGATGKTGPQGPSGKIELVTCTKVTKTIKGHRRKVQQCRGRLVSGTVKFTAAGASVRATMSRAGVIYATGASVTTRGGGSYLVLSELRPLHPGRYTLTLRSRHNGRWFTSRRSITIT